MHIHEKHRLRFQTLVAAHRREPQLPFFRLMRERNPCQLRHFCKSAAFQRADREDHDVLERQPFLAAHTAHEIGGVMNGFPMGYEDSTRFCPMDGIEIILVPAHEETLHRPPDFRCVAAVAVEDEAAVHVRIDPLRSRLHGLLLRVARDDRLPAVVKEVERAVVQLRQKRKVFEQSAREILRLINDDVRICPERIVKLLLEERLKLAQHRRQRQIAIRHQFLRQCALVVDRDLFIPAAGAQPPQEELVEAKIEHLLPLARDHARLLRCQEALARARRTVNRRRALIDQVFKKGELRIRQPRRRLLHRWRCGRKRLYDAKHRLQDLNDMLECGQRLRPLRNPKQSVPITIDLLQGRLRFAQIVCIENDVARRFQRKRLAL